MHRPLLFIPITTATFLAGLLTIARPAPAAMLLVSNEKGTSIVTLNTAGPAITTYLSSVNNPDGLYRAADGTTYFTSFTGNTLNRVNGSSFTPIASGFNGPGAMTADASGNFYVPNFGQPTGGGTSVAKVTPNGSGGYNTPVNFTTTPLSTPDGLAFDSAGVLYEADFGSGRINKINAADGTVTAYILPTAGLNRPSALVFDSLDNLYVANFGTDAAGNNGSISMIDSHGNVNNTFVTGLSSPLGLALDEANQTFYVSSYNGNTVSKFGMSGGAVTLIANGFNGPTHLLVVPEPSTMRLFGAAGFLTLRRRRHG